MQAIVNLAAKGNEVIGNQANMNDSQDLHFYYVIDRVSSSQRYTNVGPI